MLTIGAVFTALASLRFFRGDRGHTVVERGVDKLGASPRRQLLLRFVDLCGQGTDRACPGGANAIISNDSIYPNVRGSVTVPKRQAGPGEHRPVRPRQAGRPPITRW